MAVCIGSRQDVAPSLLQIPAAFLFQRPWWRITKCLCDVDCNSNPLAQKTPDENAIAMLSIVGSRGSPEWICTVDMGTALPGTPMPRTHGNDKVFHGWGPEKWQSLHLIQIWVLMNVWPLPKTSVQQASTVASFSGIFPTWNWFSTWTSYWRLPTPPLCAIHSKQTRFPCCTVSALPPSHSVCACHFFIVVALPQLRFSELPRAEWDTLLLPLPQAGYGG